MPRKAWISSAAALAVMLLLFGLGQYTFITSAVTFQMMAYLALAQGINVLYGFTGYLPFGYVGFFGAGAYGASVAVNVWHFPVLLAMLTGTVIAGLVGVILLPLLRLSGAYFAIGTLAAAEIVYNVVSNPNLQSVTNGPYGVDLSGVFNNSLSYGMMLVAVVLATLFVIYIRHSQFGFSLLALRDDPVSAAMSGVNVVRARTVAWLISALIAGMTGAIYAWHISVFYPNAVFDLSISIFAIVFTLFGGRATLWGPILGTVVLYGLYNYIGVQTPQYFQLVYGLLIVGLVLFLPNGVMSLLGKRRSKRRSETESEIPASSEGVAADV
jgi:branched-chain amino acid transport system permease protein